MVRTKKQHRTTTHTGDRNYGKQQHRICTRWLLYLSHSTQSQCSFVRSFVRCFNKTNATTTTTRTKMEAQNTVDLFIKEHQRNKKENTNPRDWNDKFCLFQTFFFFLYFYAAAAAMNSFRLWFETTTTSTTSKLQKKKPACNTWFTWDGSFVPLRKNVLFFCHISLLFLLLHEEKECSNLASGGGRTVAKAKININYVYIGASAIVN